MQEMWSLVGPAEAFITYHREWHNNDKVRVAEWSRITCAEGQDTTEEQITLTRHVFFMLPLDAPSWFTRAIGKPFSLQQPSAVCVSLIQTD
jgi:hypothetical protein